eukprot:TRINITY_DN2420_c1_g1_i1.p1 TRINITY_DN2420_c1_g1~~TRINITY_DN2420_c1_g1_i1.p1  ORF type:complete len:300 (+),score=59.12 TRINITY_DN2420_c1_g1_i1:63-902(+)
MAYISVRLNVPVVVRQRVVRRSSYGFIRCASESNENQQAQNDKMKDLKVFVAGATGRTGKCIVEKCLGNKMKTVAFVRDVSKAEGMFSSEDLEVVQGDISQYSDVANAMKSCDVVISALGASELNLLSPFLVDFEGVSNLAAAAKNQGVKKFVCVSSIGADEILNPLNLFGGVLFWKKRGEEDIQRSGLDYTIVRPGGLRDQPKEGEKPGNIIMQKANYFGFGPGKENVAGKSAILRSQVADVVVEALVNENAKNKVVEIVSSQDAPLKSLDELFTSVQ